MARPFMWRAAADEIERALEEGGRVVALLALEIEVPQVSSQQKLFAA